MKTGKKIRVLVVDDSLLSREIIAEGISSDPQITVAATAADPFEARDKILTARPDVLLCDVKMPKMNGIEFVRRLLPQYFIPVIMISAASQAVFEALEAGAVDFVAKPAARSSREVDTFIHDLINKIKAASTIKEIAPRPAKPPGITPMIRVGDPESIIAIGASTGGTEAVFNLLQALPPLVPGIVIVQHIPPVFSKMFAERLDSQTALKVKEAESGDNVERGRVLVAPGDRHMRVKKNGKQYRVECFPGGRVNGHRPSVDVLFESVAGAAGDKAIGILLTGMGHDGAKGLLAMRRRGGRTIGQDRASSVVYGMPKAAFAMGAVEIQAPLQNIPGILAKLLGAGSGEN